MKTFILLTFLIVFISSCGCYEFSRSLKKFIKPMSIVGVVSYKFIDSTDRDSPKIQFINGDVFPMSAYEMYDNLQPGDSIIKEAGSLKYVLKRKGEEPKIYYPKCDGVEIK